MESGLQPPGSDGTPWWREAVVYQIYPRSFADSNGDGIGDLRGILERLDHLVTLGVDAVWLSPIFLSPMRDFGYDVADHCCVDPIFGTNEDLDELIEALHARGIRLLLDWVPNHTSDQHPWFVESRSSRDSARRDWYVWRDRLADGSPPTNWRATFGERSAWTHDPATDQSYLHLFLPEQPDLDWSHPAVEAAMHDTLRYWLDRGVDGFRADVVHLIGKGHDVEDLPANLSRIPLVTVDRPLGHQLLRRIRRLLDGYPQQPMMVGEVYLLQPGQAASYLGEPGRGELHLAFDFRPLHASWEASALHAAIEAVQRDFAEPRWPTWVLSNHDVVRHRTRYGFEGRARAAAVLSLTVRGTPFLYAGEELGLADAVVPADRAVDPAGRDGCRAPLPWQAEGNADSGHGWSARPWLPFPANADTHAVDAQRDRADSMLTLYRRLIALRREHPALRGGEMVLSPLAGDVLRFDRTGGAERISVLIECGGASAPWPADLRDAELLLSSAPDRTDAGGRIGPYEALVLRR